MVPSHCSLPEDLLFGYVNLLTSFVCFNDRIDIRIFCHNCIFSNIFLYALAENDDEIYGCSRVVNCPVVLFIFHLARPDS